MKKLHRYQINETHLYGKNVEKISLFGTKRLITLKLGMQFRLVNYYQIYSNDDTGMILTYFTATSYFFPYVSVWEKDKNDIFVYGIKVGRWSKSHEHMKHYDYQRSRSFTDLHPLSLRFNIFKLLFLRNPLAD